MREVTPQDERDRKDAARYRQAKIEAAKVGRIPSWWSASWSRPECWDEKTDKAMEEE